MLKQILEDISAKLAVANFSDSQKILFVHTAISTSQQTKTSGVFTAVPKVAAVMNTPAIRIAALD